jgi:[acyl-carrier-protein] S-malonyltransferase
MRAFFFPGQMSEHPRMWPTLERRVPDAVTWLRRAETASGLALEEGLRCGGTEGFDDLSAQVAVLAVNAAYAHHLRRCGVHPLAVTGHSLGCYSALEAAGVLRFEEAVGLAVRVQRLAESELAGFDGAMGVLIGHAPEKVAGCCETAGEGLAQVANVNTAKQVVISGSASAVDTVLAALAPESMRAERLHTTIPFHSRWMQPVVNRLLAEVDPVIFNSPRRVVYSHLDGNLVKTAAAAHRLICTQIARPLDWPRALQAMGAGGCCRFVEVGPGEVLSRMTRWVLRDAAVLTVEKNFEEVLGGRAAPANDR